MELEEKDPLRNKAVSELEEQLQFEKMMAEISARFVNLPAAKIDQAVYDVLREIGEYFDADRVTIAKVSRKGKILGSTYMWMPERYDKNKFNDYTISQTYPMTVHHLLREGTLVFGNIDEHPDHPKELKMCNYIGIKAAVVVLLAFDDLMVEAISMDVIGSNRVWPKDISERVKFLGHVLSNAINRKRAEEELNRAFEEIKDLKNRLEQENIYLRQEIEIERRHGEIIGSSDGIREVLSRVEQVAQTDSTVLIIGETGTGKELVARAVHNLSSRKGSPLVTVSCAALPSTLIESELFGREKGAFTGALSRHLGRFEIANGSTIFLDEIGELPTELQVKLLRVLQEGQFERLGSSETISVDVRIITATNRDLAKAVQKGKFRQDLFYRLNVFPIIIPPLRERAEDIPSLVWFFVEYFAKKMGKRIDKIPQKSMEALKRYQWPGNIRELRNVIEQSMILSKSPTLKVYMPSISELESSHNLKLEEIERRHIINILKRTGWRVKGKKGAAEILGLNPSTLRFRIKKLGIQFPDSKNNLQQRAKYRTFDH